jgi:SNF2 family DNA or RNA helicase
VRDVTLNVLKHQAEYTVVVNFEAWRRDPQLIADLVALKADTIIIDEAHKMKSLNSVVYKGIKQIRFGLNRCDCGDADVHLKPKNDIVAVCDSCGKEGVLPEFCTIKNVVPMTGTPILNRPQELFPLLHMVDCENFKTESEYLRDFCFKFGDHWGWRSGGEKRLIEKIGPRFLARDPKAAGVIIPPATTVMHTITRDEFEQDYRKQFEAYEQCREYAQIILDPDNGIAMSMPARITVLLRLRQVLTWPAAIELKIENPETKEIVFQKNLDVYESAKLDKAEELIREIMEEGERIVVFSQFKAPLHILQERLGPDAIVYDGSTPDYLKQEIQLDFDPKTVPANPRWKVALCNYKAAGEGLNMNSASQMILLDREWNPGKEDQAKGRIDRLGQRRESTIHVLAVERSVDTWLASLIDEKRDIIGGFESEQQVFQSAFDALREGEI